MTDFIHQSDKTKVNPVKYAERLAADLKNVRGGARVHTVRGSPELLCVIPSCASIVNRIYAEFLSRQPHAPSRIEVQHPFARRDRMSEALTRLSEFMSDSSITERNPCSPLSFSCVSPEVLQSQTEAMQRHQQKQEHALSPLGYDGRPLRK